MPYWRLYYHLIWSTKSRHPWLTGERADIVEAMLRTKAHELHGLVHAAAVQPEHVHVAVSFPPSRDIASAVSAMKGASSFLVRRRDASLIADGFGWQAEYGAVSFNELILPKVVAYIRTQPERHADGRLWDILEADTDESDEPAP